jgi:hypothetical protein
MPPQSCFYFYALQESEEFPIRWYVVSGDEDSLRCTTLIESRKRPESRPLTSSVRKYAHAFMATCVGGSLSQCTPCWYSKERAQQRAVRSDADLHGVLQGTHRIGVSVRETVSDVPVHEYLAHPETQGGLGRDTGV